MKTGSKKNNLAQPEDPHPEGQKPGPIKSSISMGQIIKIALAFLITGVLIYWIIRHIENPREIWESICAATLLPLVAIIPLSLLSHVLRAWRWRRFIGQPVSLFYSYTSIMIGYAVNDVLPRVGEVARIVNMNRMTKVPIAHLLTTLLAERLLDILALIFMLGLSFLIEGKRIAQYFPKLSQIGIMALILSCLGLGFLFAIAYASESLCKFFRKILGTFHSGLGEKAETLIRQGAQGLAFLKKPSQAMPVLLETVGIWAIYWLVFLLGLISFGLFETSGYRGGTVAFSLTSLSLLVPAVGALGAYHEAGRVTLSELFHVDSDQALACVTVIHAVLFYVVGGVFGVLSWGIQIWVSRRK